ncbi:MAG: hypothetical protein CL561_12300 [Alphaproteobacteria bacterium]|nr:hypothetical protein [Alphaproteobacteria bacterium]|tara:strand:+ start:27421 stop:28362 length:942 start_codon:yes stop_codon:yes gene_type:complete
MMTQRTQNKSPLVMAWIGQDDPLRGDSQMAVGLAKLCAEMTGGRYVYVDQKMLEAHFPMAKHYREREILALKDFGAPDILIGVEGIRAYDLMDEKPVVSVHHIGESLSRKFCRHNMVPHNLSDQILHEEGAKFKKIYPDIKGQLVAVMLASPVNTGTLTKRLVQLAEHYDDITYFICPGRRALGTERDLEKDFWNAAVKGEFNPQMDVRCVDYAAIERGNNPYLGLLANADHVIVAGSSYSMVSDALYTEKTVHLAGTSILLSELEEKGHIAYIDKLDLSQPFPTQIMPRLDATREVAEIIVEHYQRGMAVRL